MIREKKHASFVTKSHISLKKESEVETAVKSLITEEIQQEAEVPSLSVSLRPIPVNNLLGLPFKSK